MRSRRWFVTSVCASALLGSLTALAQKAVSPEGQLVAGSLREGEALRIERALGPVDALPLYRLDLSFDPRARSVSGSLSLVLTAAKTPLDEVFLRLTPNASHPRAVVLSSASVNGAAAKLSRPDDSLYRVKWPTPVPVGATVTVDVKLAAKVPEASPDADKMPAGLDHLEDKGGDYGAFSSSATVTCLAGIVPMVPFVRPDGTLAEGPSGIGDLGTFDPSNFVLSMVVPSGYHVVAPGALMGEVPDRSGGVRFTYAVAAARELPVLVTKGYTVATANVGDITVESHFLAGDAANGRVVLTHAVNALRTAQDKLGPYPYRTFRVVEASLESGAGGMEFPGLITVASMLYRGGSDLSVLGMPVSPLVAPLLANALSASMASTLEFTVDHEVAHQYIAMLVGSDPIAEPIADEPLTQAIALLLMEWQGKADLAKEIRDTQVKMAYQMMRLLNKPDQVANRATSEFSSNAEYGGLVYGKAPLLFEAQRKLVGSAVFDRALRTYVDENRYHWVNAKTFTALLSKASPGSGPALEKLRRHWWQEKHGDEDIGGFDLESLLEKAAAGDTASGSPNRPPVDPELLKQYDAAMRALTGE